MVYGWWRKSKMVGNMRGGIEVDSRRGEEKTEIGR